MTDATPTHDIVLVHGTWGRAALWHRHGAPLVRWLEGLGLRVWDVLWSGILGGVPVGTAHLPGDPYTPFAEDGKVLAWIDAGEKLALQLRAWGVTQPHVLSHSHGYQVVNACAAVCDVDFATHVSIAGPIREDMRPIREAAVPHFRHRVQLYDPDQASDLVIVEGQFFDGRFGGPQYAIPEPGGVSVAVVGAGHSGLTLDVARLTAMGIESYLVGTAPTLTPTAPVAVDVSPRLPPASA